MNIHQLRNLAGREEIDYLFLTSVLQAYSKPRQKISRWLKSGELLRVKKGLYVFGDSTARRPWCKELLANLIYGPSAISLTYALAYYGLIPERAEVVTSITTNRNKQIQSPVGLFTYQYLSTIRYQESIQLVSSDDVAYLIATPEKALCDTVYFSARSNLVIETLDDLEMFLFEDLRIDESMLVELSLQSIKAIALRYKSSEVNWIEKYLMMRRG